MNVFVTGDSKTAQAWQSTFSTLLDAALPSYYYVTTTKKAHEGDYILDLKLAIDGYLSTVSANQDYAFVNIGINDLLNGSTDWETMKTNLGYILDAIHTKWSSCDILLAKIWSLNSVSDQNYFDDVVIPSVLETRPWARVGMDERIVLKSNDNGATNTSDGTHYSDPAGYVAVSNALISFIV